MVSPQTWRMMSWFNKYKKRSSIKLKCIPYFENVKAYKYGIKVVLDYDLLSIEDQDDFLEDKKMWTKVCQISVLDSSFLHFL